MKAVQTSQFIIASSSILLHHCCIFQAGGDLQAVYADAYVKASSNLGPARSAIVLNELNNYNGQVALAAQKLVLSTTSTARAEQRTL